ncbi:MAG: aldo/keto reductase [Clostridia bacterium]|nr:aldo/keto reductase [Clostridia bacterium]
MLYRRCGNSGVKLSAVALGFWHNFGESASFENCRALVRTAFDLGITYFDLANNYGPYDGHAEETFGKILDKDMRPYRDEMFIATKAGYYMWPGPYGDWGSKKYLVSSLDQSLKRMKLDYVDLFYHHRPDPETPLEETMDALAHIVRSGKALYVGISNYNPEQTAKAVDILANMGVHCLIHQPRYNMFNRTVEEGLYDVLKEKGVGSAPFCPLAQGLLTNRYFNGIPEDSRANGHSVFLTKEAVTEENVSKAKKLNEIAEKRGQTLAEMALAWCLRTEVTTSVIIGASKVSQIKDNVKAVENISFTEEELKAIDEILK